MNSETQRLWQEILEKDDRTSPAEYPDMALITFDEFATFVAAHAIERKKRLAVESVRDELIEALAEIRDMPITTPVAVYEIARAAIARAEGKA